MIAMQDHKGVTSTSRVSRLGVKAYQNEIFLRIVLNIWAAATGIIWYNVGTYVTQEMTATLQHTHALQQGTQYVN